MIFTGSYRSPTTVFIPGQIQFPADNFNKVFRGEDIDFSFPKPTADGTYVLVITESTNEEPLITSTVEWYVDQNEDEEYLTFTIVGGEAKTLFPGGIYFFSLVKAGEGDPAAGFVMAHNGSFHVEEVPGGLIVDASASVASTVDPARLDLLMYRGTVFASVQLTLRDSDGTLMNLTNYALISKVKDSDGNEILDLQPTSSTPTSGVAALIQISSSATPDYAAGEYSWDFLIQDLDDDEIYGPFFYGTFTISNTVSL